MSEMPDIPGESPAGLIRNVLQGKICYNYYVFAVTVEDIL